MENMGRNRLKILLEASSQRPDLGESSLAEGLDYGDFAGTLEVLSLKLLLKRIWPSSSGWRPDCGKYVSKS